MTTGMLFLVPRLLSYSSDFVVLSVWLLKVKNITGRNKDFDLEAGICFLKWQ